MNPFDNLNPVEQMRKFRNLLTHFSPRYDAMVEAVDQMLSGACIHPDDAILILQDIGKILLEIKNSGLTESALTAMANRPKSQTHSSAQGNGGFSLRERMAQKRARRGSSW